MLSIAEAFELVLSNTGRRPATRVRVAEALGLVLAEDVASDIDSPPHDRAMVDGYAVQAIDLAEGCADLSMLEEVTAGAMPTLSVSRGTCTSIMTGAPLPNGADAVAMIERSELLDSGRVRITDRIKPGQNIMPRGDSMRSGEVILHAGQEIRPGEIGLLAEVGRGEASVYSPVTVAILATGNELVDAAALPKPGQIRNSNGPMLAAAVHRAGATPIELGFARDDPAELRAKIEQGLSADVLVLSGGVSAGVLDLVPGILADLGVAQVFHKVRLKPGKPLWFGINRPKSKVQGPKTSASALGPWTSDLGPCLVFGLPGNPVSSLVCFELFVRPAIAKLTGRDPFPGLRQLRAQLAAEFKHSGDRPTYTPAIVRRVGDTLAVQPVRWRGSADLRGLTAANALAMFPAGDRVWQAGEAVDVLLL